MTRPNLVDGGATRAGDPASASPAFLRRLLRRVAYPPPRGYRLKVGLLRLSGLDVDPSVRCVSTARFYPDDLHIGRETFTGYEVRIFGGVGSHVLIMGNVAVGPGVVFLAATHEIGPSWRRAGPGRDTTIEIGSGTWIGARSVIVGPSRIGCGCIIGAGAVVRGDVADNTLYVSASESRTLQGHMDDF